MPFRCPVILTALCMPVLGCAQLDYEPISFTAIGSEIVARGEVDDGALDRFIQTARAHPEAKTLVLQHVGGSVDDAANLELSKHVRRNGFATRVPADGMVASGGTDLFLAGEPRVLEEGACVGVHSWSNGETEGSNISDQSPAHAPYLSYYRTVDVPETFYWFTLNAAPSDEMHWMTSAEVQRFNMIATAPNALSTSTTCDSR